MTMNKDFRTTAAPGKITREQRELHNGHRSAILWFTGLPAAGKSTLAEALDWHLQSMGYRTFVLDGDLMRRGLCSDLGYSNEERSENIRRIGEVAKLFLEAGIIVLVAMISPFRKDRDRVRAMCGANEFFEIYCRCPVEVCEQRDPKGHYLRARAGEIKQFTGISSPYEEPTGPDLVLNTAERSVEDCVRSVHELIVHHGLVRPSWMTP